MIEIKEKKARKGSKKPKYKLIFNYMIGDANGNTTEEMTVDTDHPYLERFVKLMNKLKPSSGTWGIILEEYNFSNKFSPQLKEDDLNFLEATLFEHWGEIDEDEENPYLKMIDGDDRLQDFCESVRGETEYSFLVFEGIDLYYIDEYGVVHDTVIK